MQLTIELEQHADGRWIATVPTLCGVRTDGADRAEALAKVQALALRVLAERLAEGEAAPDPLTFSFQTAKEYRLGVLLVHGIGTQRLGETLVRWGDVLLKTIDHATRHRVEVTAGPACRDGKGQRENRAESVVRLRAGNREERWLFSEGWWADAFLAPTYRELVSWSVRALPWSTALYIAQRYWQAVDRKGVFAKGGQAAVAAAQLLVVLALAPLFILLLMLALILGLLPIPRLRTFILTAQGTLAATVGDSFAFVESPVRAALIRTRVLNGLERLKQRCEHTIIIAHSQGAAVVLDALGGIPEPVHEGGKAAAREAPDSDSMPDTLVTFGAGTNQLASLKVLSKGLPSNVGTNPTLLAITALAVAAVLSAWLYADIMSLRTTPSVILYVLALVLPMLAVLSFWTILSPRLMQFVRERRPAVRRIYAIGIVISMGVYFLVGLLLSYHMSLGKLPWQRVWYLSLALVVVALSMFRILSKDIRDVVTIVRKAPGLSRWTDFYASADPVPNGPTRSAQTDMPDRSIRITNLGSILADHTAYWDNLDGFVLRVVRECAQTAGSPWLTELPPVTDSADRRSAWRVGWLRLARWGVVFSWLFVGAYLWIANPRDVPLPFELPVWLPPFAETAARFALLAALVALVCWASLGALGMLWRCWVRAEQESVLTRRKPTRGNDLIWLSSLLCAVVYLIFGVGFLVVRPELFDLDGTLMENLVQWAFLIWALVYVSTQLLLRLKPGPEDASSEADDAGG